MKIQICGPSGAGKTTMAKYIAERFNIPYVHTSGPQLRAKYDCRNHSDIIRMSALSPHEGRAYQDELAEERKQLSSKPEYVMDRSFIDLAAYYMLQNSPHSSNAETHMALSKAILIMPKCTHLIFIPCQNTLPEDDSVRVQNTYYQQMTWEIMKWVTKEVFRLNIQETPLFHNPGDLRILVLDVWNLDQRKSKVLQFLSDI